MTRPRPLAPPVTRAVLPSRENEARVLWKWKPPRPWTGSWLGTAFSSKGISIESSVLEKDPTCSPFSSGMGLSCSRMKGVTDMFLADMARGRAGTTTRVAWRRMLLLNIVIETVDCGCCQLDRKTWFEVSMIVKERNARNTAYGKLGERNAGTGKQDWPIRIQGEGSMAKVTDSLLDAHTQQDRLNVSMSSRRM